MTVKKKTAKKTVRRRKPVAKKATARRRRRRSSPVATAKTTRRRRPAVKAVAVRRTHKRRHSGAGKTDVKSLLINAAIGIGGALLVSFGLSHIPKDKSGKSMIPENIAPFMPIAVGAALAILLGKKNKMFVAAGSGAMIAGGLNLAKVHFPQLGLGDDQIARTPEQIRAALLGFDGGETQGVNMSGYEGDLGTNTSLLGTNTSLLGTDVSIDEASAQTAQYEGDFDGGEYGADGFSGDDMTEKLFS